jgi:hypothetical protein
VIRHLLLPGFSQRFTFAGVKSPMNRTRLGFRISKIDIGEMWRASALLLTILMTIAFFTGCETNKKEQAKSNSVLRETPPGHEIHGEVGAMYGASARRH